jgi:hypothetical protein
MEGIIFNIYQITLFYVPPDMWSIMDVRKKKEPEGGERRRIFNVFIVSGCDKII